MLFKLSIKNMKKSFKDYTIYFITLVLGVAIFYIFNSLDSQKAMLDVSKSTSELIDLMLDMLSYVSVFVSIILGFLIVYASNFLIRRRKKEFGIYMTLGMGKRKISSILLIETILIGIISLGVGLVIGVFGSQFMSIVIAKMFNANMSRYQFTFSSTACIKTCIYYSIMYLLVMLFNTLAISRYKLIDLLTAVKKNEKVKIKNPVISIIIFILASLLLSFAYYKVTGGINTLSTGKEIFKVIVMGIIATFFIFYSLSGFILKLVQSCKKIYLKNTNMFILRQINNKINTTVISMTIICIMLFMTITVLSSSLSLKNSMTQDLEEMTPVDVNLYKTANLPDNGEYTSLQIEDSKLPISETLKSFDFDINNLKDIEEIYIYATNELTLNDTLNNVLEDVKKQFPMLRYETAETIIKVSDYNRIARLYGIDEYQLDDNEYILLCDFDSMINIRNKALKEGNDTIKISGEEYKSKYNECKSGFVLMSTSHTNTGIILVPDSCKLTDDMKEQALLVANYNANSDDEKEKIEYMLTDTESGFGKKCVDMKIELDGMTKISLVEASVGVTTIVIFIAIYLGIIFLIASSAILALKELTESSDNKQRYSILRKIGVDEKMINKSLFVQIGIFFIIPLVLAILHSIFGIKFALSVMSMQTKPEELIPSIVLTVIFMVVIYGAYFLATYFGSKNIIQEE